MSRLRVLFRLNNIVLRLTFRVRLASSRVVLEIWSFINLGGRWCPPLVRVCCCRNVSLCRMIRVGYGWWLFRFVFVLFFLNRLYQCRRLGVLVVGILICCRRLFVKGRLFRLLVKSLFLGLRLES